MKIMNAKLCREQFVIAFLIIASKWNQSKCPSKGDSENCGASIWWNITQ